MSDEYSYRGLEQLASVVSVDHEFLQDVVSRKVDPYQEFSIPKRRGTARRTISSPVPELARTQRWILENILAGSRVGGMSFAYSKGISVKDCAGEHLGATWLVKLDLQTFFDSITEHRVVGIFEKKGFTDEGSRQLARICTRKRPQDRVGHLAQGAPTSGMLANLAAHELDLDLLHLARRYHLTYTRYSDDLFFSSRRSFSRAAAWAFVQAARSRIAAHHFVLNEEKIRIRPPGSRLVVLGLLVDSDRVRLRTDVKKTIKWHVYGSGRFGIDQYSTSRGFESIEEYLHHVDGLFSYAVDVEPEWAKPLRENWNYISSAPAGRLLGNTGRKAGPSLRS